MPSGRFYSICYRTFIYKSKVKFNYVMANEAISFCGNLPPFLEYFLFVPGNYLYFTVFQCITNTKNSSKISGYCSIPVKLFHAFLSQVHFLAVSLFLFNNKIQSSFFI